MSFPICLIQSVAFLDLLAVHLIIHLVSSHVQNLGANHLHIGVLGSIYAGFQLGSGPLVGSLSDIKGRKSILIISLLVCSLTYATMGMTTSIIVVLITRAVLGLFKQTQMLTRALVPDYEKDDKKQSEIYGKMAAISGIGITLGPVLGGHIAEAYPEDGFSMISMIVCVIFACNAGLIFFLPTIKARITRRKSKSHDTVRASKNTSILHSITSSLKQSVIDLYKVDWSVYWDIFMLKALIAFAMGVYYSSYSTYLQYEYNLSPKHTGYMISFQSVVGSVACYFMGYINSFYKNDENYSTRNFHVFMTISIALIGIILSFHIYIYILCLIPLAIGNAIGRLVTLEMILKQSHGDHRGMLIGASNSVRSLAGVVAPMVAGYISQYYGVTFTIYASVCSTFLGLIMSYHYRNRKLKED